jgi:hypothetical protein
LNKSIKVSKEGLVSVIENIIDAKRPRRRIKTIARILVSVSGSSGFHFRKFIPHTESQEPRIGQVDTG